MLGNEGGYLIARIFGGSGELDNLVAMDKIVNTSKYKKVENQWQKALKEGKEVQVTIDIVYDGENKRPKEFSINYSIDGKKVEKQFLMEVKNVYRRK